MAAIVRWVVAAVLCAGPPGWMLLQASSDDRRRMTGPATVVAIVGAGAALLLVRVFGHRFASKDRLAPLVDALAERRHFVVGCYLALLAAWIYAAWGLAMAAFTPFDALAGHRLTRAGDDPFNYVFAITFVGLHALFLFGAGRVRVSAARPRPSRLIISIAIFVLLMSIVTSAGVLTLLQLVARIQNSASVRTDALSPNEPWLIAIPLTVWTFWFVIAWFAVKDQSHPRALSRLTGILLAGSWVEFFTALPVELAIRPRTESCPCESGSWIGLVMAGPILVWTFGPAVFLLYFRERRLTAADPRHARRVLLAKTSRRRVEAV